MSRQAGPTQYERVRDMLERGWVCGSHFLDARIPRYSAHVHELRRAGYMVERRPCEHPWHEHRSLMYEWRITARPGQTAPLPGVGP